jgi:hypothetical protein
MRRDLFQRLLGYRLALAVPILLGAGVVACAASDAASSLSGGPGERTGDGGAPSASSSSSGGSSGSGDAAPNPGGKPDVEGVIVVHASPNLPAFRVCFDGYGQYSARPANNTMPQSNLPGIDVGSAVHIGSLTEDVDGPADPADAGADASKDAGADASKDAGNDGSTDAGADGGANSARLFVFLEENIRGNDQSCADLLRTKADNKDYYAVPLADPAQLTQGGGIALVAIQGCVAGPDLNASRCGSELSGKPHNLRARVIKVAPQNTPGKLAVQALFVSDALRTAQSVELFFGATPGTKFVDHPEFLDSVKGGNSALTPPNSPTLFELPEAGNVFDAQGFRVEVLRGSKSTVVFQSLAQTQALSDPLTVPSDYYKLPSNFVVLVLGEDQPVDLSDPNRALHMLAFPVRDPRQFADAGGDQ